MTEKLPIYFPTKPSKGFFKSQNSKFEAFLFPCDNIQLIENELKKLRKEFYDATHICYAWRLGFSNPSFRTNDDGEPTYSAGMPIYRKIIAYEISNALIAVVRYFGGTKLGIPGLIKAYETAAEYAILNTSLSVYVSKTLVVLTVPLQQIYLLYSLLKSFNHEILEENYHHDKAYFTLSIVENDLAKLELIIHQQNIPIQISSLS